MQWRGAKKNLCGLVFIWVLINRIKVVIFEQGLIFGKPTLTMARQADYQQEDCMNYVEYLQWQMMLPVQESAWRDVITLGTSTSEI